MGATLAYIIPIIFTVVLLIFWRHCTIWDTFTSPKFPTRFHVLFFSLVSLIPAVNIVTTLILFAVYVCNRLTGDIVIKPNNFSKFWFDVKDKEEENKNN